MVTQMKKIHKIKVSDLSINENKSQKTSKYDVNSEKIGTKTN